MLWKYNVHECQYICLCGWDMWDYVQGDIKPTRDNHDCMCVISCEYAYYFSMTSLLLDEWYSETNSTLILCGY